MTTRPNAFALMATLSALVASAQAVVPTHAAAYNYGQSGGLKNSGVYEVELMCGNISSSNPWVPMPTSGSDGTSFAAIRPVVESAYWMWDRDVLASSWLAVASGCRSGGLDGGWRNPECVGACTAQQDTHNEFWFESQSITSGPSVCNSGVLGCETTWKHLAGGGLGTSYVQRTDVTIANSGMGVTYGVLDQDTLAECVDAPTGGMPLPNLIMHEIGHSYGLAHDNSQTMTLMRSSVPFANNCHAAQGFTSYPFADEFFAKAKANGSASSSHINVAGSIWRDNSSGGEMRDPSSTTTISGSWGSATLTFQVSIMSYYKGARTPRIRWYLFPLSDPPSFDWSSNQWDVSSAEWSSLSTTSPTVEKESRTVTLSETISGLLVSAGDYRVWVYVDHDRALSERDEGDNMFPTQFKVTRTI